MIEPVDTKRCQAETVSYHPFIMGGNVHQRKRCEGKAEYVVVEKLPDVKGERGRMSMCRECIRIWEEKTDSKAQLNFVLFSVEAYHAFETNLNRFGATIDTVRAK